jgi:hypothetical protein
VKIRAKVLDPKSVVTGLTLHYRARAMSTYTIEVLKRERDGATWSGFIRDPQALAPAGVTDNFGIDYFISAEDATSRVVDTNGSDDAPIALEVTSLQVEQTTAQATDQMASLELRDGPPPAPVVVVETPWYLRWYTITAASVIVAGATGGIVYAATRPAPLPPHIGEISYGSTP